MSSVVCCGVSGIAHLFLWLSGSGLRVCHRICTRLCVRIVRHSFGELLLLLDPLRHGLGRSFPSLGLQTGRSSRGGSGFLQPRPRYGVSSCSRTIDPGLFGVSLELGSHLGDRGRPTSSEWQPALGLLPQHQVQLHEYACAGLNVLSSRRALPE